MGDGTWDMGRPSSERDVKAGVTTGSRIDEHLTMMRGLEPPSPTSARLSRTSRGGKGGGRAKRRKVGREGGKEEEGQRKEPQRCGKRYNVSLVE